MIKLRNAVLSFALCQAAVFAADQGLLRMLMPDAKVIAGIQVDSGKTSKFGQYVLSHMQLDDENFKKFIADTGFDPRRDVSEIVMGSNWSGDAEARWLVLARGVFNSDSIARAVQANGGTATSFQGVKLLSSITGPNNQPTSAIAFLNPSEAAMGDPTSVKAAIQRYQTGTSTLTNLGTAKLQDVMAKNDFWFITLVPISEFAGAMPDANLSQAMQGNLLQGITQASGGIKFGSNVHISADVVTRSDKDAGALVDVVRFIAGMIQLNRDKSATASDVSSLVDTMELKTAGNVMSMSLLIPEAQLEKILDGAKSEAKHTARKQ